MKWSWAAAAAALVALGMVTGCNDYNNSVQYSTGATITNLSPSGIPAGTPPGAAQCQNTSGGATYPCFTIYVVASSRNSFQTSSVVEWNGQKMPTTYLDSTDISATIPYSYVANPGTAYVSSWYPQSGTGMNGLSNALTFIIYGAPNPYPTLSSITPTSAPYCAYSTTTSCPSVSLTLNGNNFIPVSQNGGSSVTVTAASTYNQQTAITVNSFTTTQLKATIPGKMFCATGTAYINVINPPSAVCLLNCPNLGGGDTNNPPEGQQATTQTFTITNTASANTCPPNVPVTTPTEVHRTSVGKDGRYVVYHSTQSGVGQILLRDTCLGAANGCIASTQVVSVAVDGSVGNADSDSGVISADGRYVAFSSSASNLVENAPPGPQIYVRDTCKAASSSCRPGTALVSKDSQGQLAGAEAILPSISASGRYVAFVAVTPGQGSPASVQARTALATRGGLPQVFVTDTCAETASCTRNAMRVSTLAADSSAAGVAVEEEAPSVSEDGRYVAYAGLQNGTSQILLSDTCLNAVDGCTPSTRTISAAADGAVGNADSHNVVLTPDGRYAGFSSAASNLVENAPAGRQVYLRDMCIGAGSSCKASVSIVSSDSEGQLAGSEAILPSISDSGRFVAFVAVTASQTNGGQNASQTNATSSGLRQVFVRDTCLGAANCAPQTTRIALQPVDANAPAGPALAGLGKQMALSGGQSATVFTATIPVDANVFLAIPSETK